MARSTTQSRFFPSPILPHLFLSQSVKANPAPRQPSTIQNALFPSPPGPTPALTVTKTYISSTTSSITSSETSTTKKAAKGFIKAFNPKSPKKLTIYYASSYPAWQDKYIDLVRQHFSTIDLTMDEKAVNLQIPKEEKKKAVPFVQGLKRRLQQGEASDAVFNRKMPFEEGQVLAQMEKGLKRMLGCQIIEVVEVIDGGESGKKGILRVGDAAGAERELRPEADFAVPGQPSCKFENI